ncbi:MAG TPA: hypothetical protein VGK17_03665 [Propionicimonas sp.]|jgi:hypothetical protein
MPQDLDDQIAPRARIAQSWWIASELVRRNRALFVYGYHPGGGTYDCLGSSSEAAREFPAIGRPSEPRSHVWALLRDEEPVALFDIHGTVHTRTASAEAMPV